jgi:hypothetical protein
MLSAWYLTADKTTRPRTLIRTNTTLVYEYPSNDQTSLHTARSSIYLTSGNLTIEVKIIDPLPMRGYLPLVLQNDTLQFTGTSWVQPTLRGWNITAPGNVTVQIVKVGWYTLSLIGPVYYDESKSSSGGTYRSSGWGTAFSGSEIHVEAVIWVGEDTAKQFKVRTYP